MWKAIELSRRPVGSRSVLRIQRRAPDGSGNRWTGEITISTPVVRGASLDEATRAIEELLRAELARVAGDLPEPPGG
jgi:hypothetical protein